MKLEFCSTETIGGSDIIPRQLFAGLDKLPDGKVYDTRGIMSLLKCKTYRIQCKNFTEAGYCVMLKSGPKKLWWGNKATIVALKKEFKLS